MDGKRGGGASGLTAAAYFRYAWITLDGLQELVVDSRGRAGEIVRLAREAAGQAEAARGLADRSGALRRLIGFAEAPSLIDAPTEQFCQHAAGYAEQLGDAPAAAFARAVAQLVCAVAEPSAQHQRSAELGFLERLATSDFPVLLLWSDAQIADRLFELDAGGHPRFRSRVLNDPKRRGRAVGLALRYAFGALGRSAPRDGWCGAGFARLTPSAPPAILERGHDRLVVEPDLRTIPHAYGARIEPGETAWDVALRFAENEDLSRRLVDMQGEAGSLGPSAWDFGSAQTFLGRAQPFSWWVSQNLRRRGCAPGGACRERERSLSGKARDSGNDGAVGAIAARAAGALSPSRGDRSPRRRACQGGRVL